ncbi:helix-turn-helix transcriptional regulator [Paenibacillus beijingensis]|uniref:HTH araC/xylS-type domain-containing protein n=1 Tax=Paenibacillus beijingensis TaxID=1126833 RepID=A0A0D5NL30_9BACL|nr:AraC family transcriptional regulator [Paenibacillus beijingensis]AJY75613.1 hypothetical protein VN24_14915 [Paenibacillus beijingensis]
MLELISAYFDNMDPNWYKDEACTPHHMFILMTRGNAVYRLNGIEIPLSKGDLLFIPKGTLRAARNSPEGPHQKYSAQFEVPNFARFPIAAEHSGRTFRSTQYEYIKQRFMLLNQQWFGRLPHYKMICEGMLMELIGCLAREAKEERFHSIKLRLMKEVRQYILAHYREAIRIEQLAKLIDRAPNYVTQTFKEVFGATPITYLHQVRIQAARDLILNTHMTMGEISEYLGYSDQAYFNRMFRRIMGHPPTRIVE